MSTLERAIHKLQSGASTHAGQQQAAKAGLPTVLSGRNKLDEALTPCGNVSIDYKRLLANGLVPTREHHNVIDEQYRSIKRPLLANAFGKNAADASLNNLLMVTSALAGEGKTFSSFNLATSMAQEPDRPVLLVDADLVQPQLTHAIGADDLPGLLDLLADDSLKISDVLYTTDIPNLRFIPRGRTGQNPAELLASQRMTAVLDVLSAKAGGMVIFDSPPLLLTNESRVLASQVGQVVLVVAAAKTLHTSVLDAIALIDEQRILNLVLNRAARAADGFNYGYGTASR